MAQCEWVYGDGRRCGQRAAAGDLFCSTHKYNPGHAPGVGGFGGGGGAAPSAAPEYGQRVSEAATTAREYVSDKISVVGDKFSDLRDIDYAQATDNAKQYVRQNPGQALLLSAAAGFVIGFLLRGGRR